MSWFRKAKTNFKDAQEGKSFSYSFTTIIGLGFFTAMITWSMYNIYVPIFLRNILTTTYGDLPVLNTIIGIIMILDNIAAITLQPWIGNISDNVWTKFGRRMPFLMVGIPIAAVFFGLLPLFDSLVLILVIIGGFNIAMAVYRSPVVALMPDLVSKKYRSRGNAIINLVGGVGSLIGLFVMPFIYDINKNIAFWVVSIIIVICLVVVYFTVKEREVREDFEEESPKEKVKFFEATGQMFRASDKSLLFILLAICAWFFAFNALETWFSTYGVEILDITESAASLLLGAYSLTFIIFALPAGHIAKKLGRRNTILIGLIGLVLVILPMVLFSFIYVPGIRDPVIFLGMDLNVESIIIAALLAVGGIFWAMVNINSIVIVWELAGDEKLGTYTGIYYFFSALAAISSPLIAGGIFDAITAGTAMNGVRYLFVYSSIFFVLALFLVLFVKSGGKEGET